MRPAAARLKRWRESPVTYVRECLKAEPDEWQVEVLEAYAAKNRIALKSSKGPGKSTVLAWIGWHFLSCFPHPKAVATSISGENLRDNLWTELAKWQGKSEFLKQSFTWNAERIVANDHPETWWLSARQWPKSADKTQQADTLAGIHGDFVLFLIDEAGGIPDAVVAAAEGGLANAEPGSGRIAKLVLAGNPTHLSGPLYRACTRERDLWWVKEISGDPDDPKRAPRVSIAWAREQIGKFGRDNPWVLVNVFGQFPPAQSNALVGVETVTSAARRTLSEPEYMYAPKVLGVDVARFGDDRTVLFPRQGAVAMRPTVFRNLDTMEVVGQVAMAIERWKPDGVFVDVTGLGAGVVDRLLQLGHDVVGIGFGDKAMRAEPKLANRRTEMWWAMTEWLKGNAAIPDDSELISELTAPTYKFDAGGRVLLEPKDDLKRRGLPSPDLADALALTFALPVQPRHWSSSRPVNSVHRSVSEYDPFQERT